jgi:Icc-related predicted phosphoesterase
MLFVSDVHGALEPLRRLASSGETLIILGDLVNLTDYRSGEGAIADALGIEFARSAAEARAAGDYMEMRALWAARVGDRMDEIRTSIGDALRRQYEMVAEALHGGNGYVIHGNVDRPEILESSLPDGFSYVHGEVIDIEGQIVGFAGGGVSTPIHAAGEVSDAEMTSILRRLGEVDVLCSHVAPAVRPLRTDVITGREERGSDPIRDYVKRAQPGFHFYGDVHQPQATSWRLGRTRCHNAGYFRATGRYLRLDRSGVQPGRMA